ncbi:MAG: aldo/keto reductase [SAR202 cluster bacterium]|nr:aldo/keto reductase [SAR202 cluster bacterium]HAL46645.1 aldo/keto reductase [Dehalococcoidia bacterium]MDP6662475.1 aldo/keto reductase [SAR202 cluster bacterium]MDP6800141.1 aldo/keto reductase [SAR202 cluster bacterium]MQG56792.1 aldo/keto reductase [SAR202 cluster bacterium]|tara:strand:- start:1477 stop:2388 length:912 start_codon:yes stop_codon:yes gene_type:complete
METRRLGRDGPDVSAICFGAWPIGGGMGTVADQQAIATVQTAVDAGMTFIDTAESYRTSEELIGRAIVGRRNEIFLATKLSGSDHSREHIDRAIENSLKTMGTDHVDLYQLHSPQPQWPIEETMSNLLRLRDQGKIRFIGISNYSAEQTVEAVQYGPIHSSQPRYHMFGREPEESILPACLENGIGVIPHSVLAKGLLTGRYSPGHVFPPDDERHTAAAFSGSTGEGALEIAERLQGWARDHGRDLVQLAIAWTLAHPSVASSIVGAKSPEQVLHNAKADDWRLSDSDLREIDEMLGGFSIDE